MPLFGTDGVRGLANGPLTADLALTLAQATAVVLGQGRTAEAVRRTVRGMLPKNRLGRQMLKKLKVYAGPTHPHAAQQPQPLAIEHARARA